MPKLSPKLYRNLYKIFILNRPLAHKIDKIFAKYIKEFEYEKKLFEFDNQFDYDEVIKGSKLNISKKEEEANTKNWIDLSTSFLK